MTSFSRHSDAYAAGKEFSGDRVALAALLEGCVDTGSVSRVLALLAEVCIDKGQHLRDAWQDDKTARAWEQIGSKIEDVADAVDRIR